MITFIGSKSLEHEELFSRSVIEIAISSRSSHQILDHILVEGVSCLTIKPMGMMLHSVTFSTFEDKHKL